MLHAIERRYARQAEAYEDAKRGDGPRPPMRGRSGQPGEPPPQPGEQLFHIDDLDKNPHAIRGLPVRVRNVH